MKDQKEATLKALESYLSGKQESGRGTEVGQKELSKEDIEMLKAASTKDIKIKGRKKGKITPRQTVRIDEAMWKNFQAATRRKESKSASEVLREFIMRYIGGK